MEAARKAAFYRKQIVDRQVGILLGGICAPLAAVASLSHRWSPHFVLVLTPSQRQTGAIADQASKMGYEAKAALNPILK